MKKQNIPAWIYKIPQYVPGRSKEEISRAYGIKNPIKMASNENPLGASPMALEAMKKYRYMVNLYPDPLAYELRKTAAQAFNCGIEQIIAGNGSDEIIELICKVYIEPGDEVIIPQYTFSYYEIASLSCGAHVTHVPMQGLDTDIGAIKDAIGNRTKILFIANPNNPTGMYLNKDRLSKLISIIPDNILVVIDEAYTPFVRADDFVSGVNLIDTKAKIFVLMTLSKSHGLAGLRVGFGIAMESILDPIWRIKPPFNVNTLAQKAGIAALEDNKFLQDTITHTWRELDYLCVRFEELGLEFVPTQTNFVLVKIGKNARDIYESLLKKGIIVRNMASYGLDEYIRVSVGLSHENTSFITALKEILKR